MYGIYVPQTRSGKVPQLREPKYPDDFDVLVHSGPGATISLSSFVGQSSAAAMAAEGEAVVYVTDDLRRGADRKQRVKSRARAAADYDAAVAADPSLRRICRCGCGRELTPTRHWRTKKSGYRPGHNSRKAQGSLFKNPAVDAALQQRVAKKQQARVLVSEIDRLVRDVRPDLFQEVA
jgi:hypothetical protein